MKNYRLVFSFFLSSFSFISFPFLFIFSFWPRQQGERTWGCLLANVEEKGRGETTSRGEERGWMKGKKGWGCLLFSSLADHQKGSKQQELGCRMN